ncbi:MAG: NAD-dependent epimerase/dehydratase family protein [Pirellulales bacterium]
MRVLVIGGTGFIGPWVVRHLAGQGHTVALFHRGHTAADLSSAVSHIHGDRQNLTTFTSEFAGFGPDVVLDMFPYVEQEAALLMQTFRGMARRVVAVSSMDVYRAYGRFSRLEDGPPDLHPFTEEAPLRSALYPYRASAQLASDLAYNYEKILVEQTVMGDAMLPGTVLRLPQVYGPGDPQHRLFEFLKRMIDKRPIILLEEGRARWRWTRGYVENVAAAVARAVTDDRAERRIYNVGDKEAFTETEWVERIGNVAGWIGSIRVISGAALPAHLAAPYDWRHHLVADTSRIRKELAYEDSIPIDEALRRTVAWEYAHLPAQVDHFRFDYPAEDAACAKTGAEPSGPANGSQPIGSETNRTSSAAGSRR